MHPYKAPWMVKKAHPSAAFFYTISQNEPLFFYHVPKTAGTSVSLKLADAFGSRMFLAQSQKVVDDNRSQLQNYDIISGHLAQEFIYSAVEKSSILTLMRDPIQRAISQYNNWRDQSRIQDDEGVWQVDEEARHAIRLASDLDVQQFLSVNENQEILKNTRNVFTRAFINRTDVDPLVDDDYLVEEAFENIRRFFWIGIVDRMSESCSLLAMQLGQPSLKSLAVEYHNVSTPSGFEKGVDHSALKKLNRLDYKLIDLVRSEFDRRIRCALASELVSYIAAPSRDADLDSCIAYHDSIQFVAGWSYKESTADGHYFRWCYSDFAADLEIMLQNGKIRNLTGVTLHAAGIFPDVDPSNVMCEVSGTPFAFQGHSHSECGHELRFASTAPVKTTSRVHVRLLVPTAEQSVPKINRDALGLALSHVSLYGGVSEI